MRCPWCDNEISEFNGYCSNCGNELVDFEKQDSSNFKTPELNEESVPKVEHCPKCHGEMLFLGDQELQRSSSISNLFFGELGDLIKGTLRLVMFVCKNCGKAEFSVTEDTLLRLKDYGQLD
ncbi:zf-TFIIB domain-containing protein [Brevibacillus choshinensis]|uniref:Zf-TFIIB domain-containing protein n=1 Tax=Brevibacillus choshinensis TaxID=54911 RepID=A0ABX7FJ15_BRECH|nr:zf-TFIIB domain-containing protein [Brevibacillus choshinensis]QRG65272.1 zf-TFIIB domain-containing protein [Brevibacillus choshinensis]